MQLPLTAPPDATHDRLAEAVAFLASLDRRTSTPGERRAGEWVAEQLRAAGVANATLQAFRTQSSWAPAGNAHMLAGLAAAALGGAAGRLLGTAAAVSYEADISGRSHWVRRLLPAGRGATVEARIAPTGPKLRTVVLVAHIDAAHNGWVWHPRFVEASRRRSEKTGKALPSHLVPLLALAATATGARPLRAAGAALAALGLGLFTQSQRSPTAPGANDNATAVAAALELARRLAAQPLAHTEVILLFPGGEEVGTTGTRAWLREHGRALDRETTLMIGLDSLGSGGAVVLPRREALTCTYDAADLALAEEAARRAGLQPPQRVTFGNVTDAMMGRQAGLHAFAVLSYADGWIKNLHRPTDTPGRVQWSTVHDALALTAAAIELWDERAPSLCSQ